MQKLKTFTIKSVSEEGDSVHFEGLASTFGNVDRHGDIMVAGCFDDSIRDKPTVPMCLNHDWNIVIGKMALSLNEEGLWVKGTFNLNDANAKNVYDLMKMGALDSFSIGFFIKDYDPIDTERPYGGWNIKKAEVFEVSVVTVPANPQATVERVKSADVAIAVSTAVEKHLEKASLISELEKLGGSL
ncbi:TPA: HK97 family phage prohead protease [Streptococcus suis]